MTEGETGYLFEPGNADSLAEAMKRAAAGRENWAAMGRRGQELVRQKLSWDRIAENVLSVYRQALNQPPEGYAP